MRPSHLATVITLTGAFAAVQAPGPAAAVEFRAGQNVVVGADEVVADDLYATGETVTIDGRVEGDVIASGREIRINGEATGDLMAAGQAVVVNGVVGDDVRMAGMVLKLGPGASVGDDVVAAGFSLETGADSLVAGSLLFSGFQALLAGDLGESLTGSMAALEIRGGIDGDSAVAVEGDPEMPSFVQFIPAPEPLPVVAGGLTVTESARLAGELEYTSSAEARGAGAGSDALTRMEPPASPAAETVKRKPSWPGKLLRWLGLILLGLLLAGLAPGWLEARSEDVRSRPLPTAAIGLLGVAALPVGIGLALVVVAILALLLGLVKLGNVAALALVLGLVTIGALLLAFWLTASYLAPLLVGLSAGRWVLGRVAAERARGLALPLVAGLVLLALLRLVPLLGFLVALGVLLLGWGAVLIWLWRRLRPVAV